MKIFHNIENMIQHFIALFCSFFNKTDINFVIHLNIKTPYINYVIFARLGNTDYLMTKFIIYHLVGNSRFLIKVCKMKIFTYLTQNKHKQVHKKHYLFKEKQYILGLR